LSVHRELDIWATWQPHAQFGLAPSVGNGRITNVTSRVNVAVNEEANAAQWQFTTFTRSITIYIEPCNCFAQPHAIDQDRRLSGRRINGTWRRNPLEPDEQPGRDKNEP